jgi:hypothetical protein
LGNSNEQSERLVDVVHPEEREEQADLHSKKERSRLNLLLNRSLFLDFLCQNLEAQKLVARKMTPAYHMN